MKFPIFETILFRARRTENRGSRRKMFRFGTDFPNAVNGVSTVHYRQTFQTRNVTETPVKNRTPSGGGEATVAPYAYLFFVLLSPCATPISIFFSTVFSFNLADGVVAYTACVRYERTRFSPRSVR